MYFYVYGAQDGKILTNLGHTNSRKTKQNKTKHIKNKTKKLFLMPFICQSAQ